MISNIDKHYSYNSSSMKSYVSYSENWLQLGKSELLHIDILFIWLFSKYVLNVQKKLLYHIESHYKSITLYIIILYIFSSNLPHHAIPHTIPRQHISHQTIPQKKTLKQNKSYQTIFYHTTRYEISPHYTKSHHIILYLVYEINYKACRTISSWQIQQHNIRQHNIILFDFELFTYRHDKTYALECIR